MPGRSLQKQKGVALLAVLWLSVALSVMALTTSYLVRTEAEAVSNQIEAERAYYLARGGIEAAVYSMVRWGGAAMSNWPASDRPVEFRAGQRWLRYEFSQGSCVVEVVPENAKLNVNQAPVEQLAALFLVLGLPAEESQELAAAIVDWRSPSASTVSSPFDLFYANLAEPYAARHAPFGELEELLAVKGMKRDLFFGRLEESSEGSWRRVPPLADLLTTEPNFGGVNLNYAPYEVLRVLPGWNDALAGAVIEARGREPFGSLEELQSAVPAAALVTSLSPITLSSGLVYTLTATGLLPDSGARRTVRARVRVERALPLFHRVLAWWGEWSRPAGSTEAPPIPPRRDGI